MSKSIRISDELAAKATQAGELFHRSPPQQIEHWAQIGQVMEAAMSYPAQKAVKSTSIHDFDACLQQVGTEHGRQNARAIIRRTASTIESTD